MNGSAGRALLTVIAFVAVVTTVFSLGTTDRAVGGILDSCGVNSSCGGNGDCVNGSCNCDPCFSGIVCGQECSSQGVCNVNGTACVCDPCFSGALCETECSNHGFCGNGSICICDVGYTGTQCGIMIPTTSTSTPSSSSSSSTSSSSSSTTVVVTTTTTTTVPSLTFIGVVPKKLVVIDKLIPAGKAKTVYVSKDTGAGITKGAGTDESTISAEFDLRYADHAAAGSFSLPAGASNGTDGWVVNKAPVAKYVNKDAPSGPTEAKVGVVKPDKLLKLVGKGLGDVPFDIFGVGAPVGGTVLTSYCVTNGAEEICHCSKFTGCAYKLIAKGEGAKLLCKEGVGDPACEALEPPAPTCATDGSPPAFCFSQPGFCSGFGPCATCLGGLNSSSYLDCQAARCVGNCSMPIPNQACATSINSAGCAAECCL